MTIPFMICDKPDDICAQILLLNMYNAPVIPVFTVKILQHGGCFIASAL